MVSTMVSKSPQIRRRQDYLRDNGRTKAENV